MIKERPCNRWSTPLHAPQRTTTPRSRIDTLTAALVERALEGYDEDAVRGAAGRARFDYEACLRAGRRLTSLGDAAAACLQDRDDLHWPSLSHPGGIVWPVAGDSTRAAYAGYEVTVRLALALGGEHRRYWHATATAGTVGAVVAAAVALGTDPVNAAGHAISVAGGSILTMLEHSGTRVLHRLHASETGLRCARAGELAATRSGLEHERGLFAAMGGSADSLLADRERPAICEISFRLWAANGFAHAAIEAAAELAPVEEPERVEVEIPAAGAVLASNPDPRTDDEAWWSVQYAVAVTLLGLDLEDRSLLHDERVRALLPRVELRSGETSRVSVDGRTAERAAAHEATDDDLVRKWRTLNPNDEPPLELLCST